MHCKKNCNIKPDKFLCCENFILCYEQREKPRINRPLPQHRLPVHCRVGVINRGCHFSRINNACKKTLNVIYCNSSCTKCVMQLAMIAIEKETMYYHQMCCVRCYFKVFFFFSFTQLHK